MKRRAFHADKPGGAADIAAKAVDLGQQIFALKDLARLAQGQRRHGATQNDAARGIGLHLLSGQFAGLDHARAVAQDQHPLDHIAQLAHIAGPLHGLQHCLGFWREDALRQALGAVEHVDEMARQFRDILAPFLQRGHRDRHHVQAVVKFLTEAAGLDFAAQLS